MRGYTEVRIWCCRGVSNSLVFGNDVVGRPKDLSLLSLGDTAFGCERVRLDPCLASPLGLTVICHSRIGRKD